MQRPVLGFKLWKQQKIREISSLPKSFLKNFSFSTLINLFIACVGIFLAKKANDISNQSYKVAQTQLQMQKTDTSQQSQLRKLTDIIKEIQIEQNISIRLNQKTDDLAVISKTQSNTVSKQLLLSKKFDLKSSNNDSLTQDADMLSIITAFNKLLDINTLRNGVGLSGIPINQRTLIIQNIRMILESQLNNKLILNNNYLRFVWFSFYHFTSEIEIQMKFNDVGTTSTIKNEEMNNQYAAEFSNQFLIFMNKMFKPKNAFFEYFEKKALENYTKDSLFKF